MPAYFEQVAFNHPRYTQFRETWEALGHVYEGDGPFLDGTALIPHPREVLYKLKGDGSVDSEAIAGYRPKYTQRKRIARYENFASAIVDTVVDHQFRKRCKRSNLSKPYEAWVDDVDGFGTSLDDWMKATQSMASVYGHLYIALTRVSANGDLRPTKVLTRAQQGPLVLRRYLPEDVPDWLAVHRSLRAVKLIEAVERDDLFSPLTELKRTVGSEDTGYGKAVQYRVIDGREWALYDEQGRRQAAGAHGFAQLPVVPFYSRRRTRIPVIGRSLLRDPKLFADHYNLLSELRELIRNQIFSILNIVLGEKQTPNQQMELMGDHLGVDTVLFTRATASFLQPSEGPATVLRSEIEALERKIYRLVGLPWENDSLDAESADSRRLKAMDLNRILAGQADECEAFEYQLARLWHQGEYPGDWQARLAAGDGLTISYPDEFYVEQVMAEIEEAREELQLGLGKTANAEIRKRALPVILPDISAELKAKIEKEIEELSQKEADNEAAFAQLSIAGAEAAGEGKGGQEGEDEGEGEGEGMHGKMGMGRGDHGEEPGEEGEAAGE